MDPFRLREYPVDSYQDFASECCKIKTPDLLAHVDHAYRAQRYTPPPYVQINPIFRPGHTVEELVRSEELHPACADIFRVGKHNGARGVSPRLHKHLEEALARDIARTTDERTVIAAVIPWTAVGHALPLAITRESPERKATLLANLNSLVLDYIARQKIGGTHLTYGFLKQFPILPRDAYTEADLDFIVPRVLELSYTAEDLRPFAEDLGHHGPPFPFDPERRLRLRCELDARYARLYGLARDELRYILDPSEVLGPDYPSETFRVLKKREVRDYGEYRTGSLVLEAWARQVHRARQGADAPPRSISPIRNC